MKNIKFAIGIMLIAISTYAVIPLIGTERGAGLGGVLTGYGIMLVIGVLLIRSDIKEGDDSKFKGVSTLRSEYKSNNISEQKQSLKALKEKGVLTDEEYEEKLNTLNEKLIKEKVKQLDEYIDLKKLADSELLTKDEFKSKYDSLLAKYIEYFSMFKDAEFTKFRWGLYKAIKSNQGIDPKQYTEEAILGKWTLKNNKQLHFYKNGKRNEFKLMKAPASLEDNTLYYADKGKWELNNNTLKVKKRILEIKELGSHILFYEKDGKKYSAYKVES